VFKYNHLLRCFFYQNVSENKAPFMKDRIRYFSIFTNIIYELNLKKMKKNLILFFISILLWGFSYSQVSVIKTNNLFGTEEGLKHEINTDKSLGFWVLPFSGATSPWRIPGNNFRYQRAQYIIKASEILASGFPSGNTIDAISFYISAQGTDIQTGNLKIYLMNTADTTYTLGSTWTTSGFTLVSDIASWTVPIAVGPYTIPFSGGTPFTYTGGGVYVAYEFSNPSGTLGTVALSARCNDVLPSSFRGDRNNTSLPSTLATSSFRPQTQFVNASLFDIAQINNIYTLEKVSVGYNPTPISVRVTNVSSAPANFDVVVTVKDVTNTTTYYTSTQTVTNLAANTSTMVNFTGWNPSVIGDVIVYAETSAIPGENWLSNNTLSQIVNVNSNTLSYTYNNSTPSAFGYNHPNSGIFASKYFMNDPKSVIGANIVISNHASVPGNTIYAVVMNSSGTILSQSANYIVQASDLGTTKSFTFPSPPSFTNETFYIGIAQTVGSVTWRPLGIFTENPQRESTFYTAAISGGTLTEVPTINKIKFGIEAIIGTPASCLPPTAVSATNINLTSANLTWTPNGSATIWEYVYGPAPLSTPTGSGTVTSNTTNPISGLTNSTNYQFYVRSNCGGNTFSNWAGPYSFTSLCPQTIIPFTETFQSSFFPPTCWTSVAGSGTWTHSLAAGAYGQSSASAKADFYNISGSTPFDLITLDFVSTGSLSLDLSFDYAYAAYQTVVDSLNIYYSTDSGTNWTLLQNMTGGPSGTLNTGGTTSSPFVPTASQWATKTINLPVGSNKLKFSAVSSYGNNLYIDNIKVQSSDTVTVTVDEYLSIEEHKNSYHIVYSNPISSLLALHIFTNENSKYFWSIYDTNGKLIMRGSHPIVSGKNSITIETENLSPGLYILKSNINGIIKTNKIINQ